MSLMACGSDQDSSYFENAEPYFQLSAEEQRLFAPSPLFRSIYQNNELEFNEALNTNREVLVQKNFEGDTPLAVAIKLKRFPMIPEILNRLTMDEIKTPNKDGRSYISLLAEIDDFISFEIIQRRYQQQVNQLRNLRPGQYFSNYDFTDDLGRNSAHYVQSKVFLDQLFQTWFFRTADSLTIWSDLFWTADNQGFTFLHQAAQYNKFDVIQWYTDQNCGSEPMEGEYFITRALDTVAWGLGKGVQYLQEARYAPIWRKLINTKDNEGNTAAHIAAINGSYESLRSLLRCEEINPTSLNDLNQIPLTALLSQLDLFENPISEDFKLSFELLIDQINPMIILPVYNFRYFVNENDIEGKNAIFYASRLADTYFIDRLRSYDLGRVTDDGLSARDSQ